MATNRYGLRRLAAATLLGTMTMLAAACGGSGGGSDEEQIRDLVETFFEEAFGGDAEKAYDLLDSESKSECDKAEFVEQTEVAGGLLELIGGGKFKVERVSNIRINGDTATATVEVTLNGEPSDGGPDDAEFVREGGKWRIADGC